MPAEPQLAPEAIGRPTPAGRDPLRGRYWPGMSNANWPGVSDENVALMLRAVDAVNRADGDAFVACFHTDVEWEASDDRFPGFGGVYRGRAGVRRWLEEALDPWESVRLDLEEIFEAGDDQVVVGVLMTTRGEESGVETKLRLWQVFWVTDGRVARRQGPYWVRDEALAAAGLKE